MEVANGWLVIFSAVVGLFITYYLIQGAVASGMKKTNQILEQQSKILLKWLLKKISWLALLGFAAGIGVYLLQIAVK